VLFFSVLFILNNVNSHLYGREILFIKSIFELRHDKTNIVRLRPNTITGRETDGEQHDPDQTARMHYVGFVVTLLVY
jgi:hypothetical protein